jgi:hypothetical protein
LYEKLKEFCEVVRNGRRDALRISSAEFPPPKLSVPDISTSTSPPNTTPSVHSQHYTMSTAVWPPIPADELKKKEEETLVQHILPKPPEYPLFSYSS